MLLWTIMPEEIVLDGVDKTRTLQKCSYLGKNIIVEKDENNRRVIVQLLSTDPFDYLKKELSPGNEINA